MLFLNSTNLIFSAIRFENALSIIIDKSKRLAGMSLKTAMALNNPLVILLGVLHSSQYLY